MKKKCICCNKAKAKRTCLLHTDGMICSQCCVSLRNHEQCNKCDHFKTAINYQSDKSIRQAARAEGNGFPFMDENEVVFEINPEVNSQVDKALELIDERKFSKAETILKDLVRRHPNIYTVHFGLSNLYFATNDLTNARISIEESVRINPLFPQGWNNLQMLCMKMMDITGAIKSARKVIETADTKSRMYYNASRYVSSFEKKMKKTAGVGNIDDFLKGQETFNQALEAMDNGEYEDSLHLFKETVKIMPIHNQSYGNIGLVYAFLGQKEKALEALDKALEIDPKYKPAIINRRNVVSMTEGVPMKHQNCNIVNTENGKEEFLKQ